MSKAKFDRSKPHVNIGTIGHVDHGKTSLTAAITNVLAKAGRSNGTNPMPIHRRRSRRKGARGITINTATRRVRNRCTKALRTRRLPGTRRLHQEHDHRSRTDGRGHPRRLCRRRTHATDPRAHPARPSGRRAFYRRVLEQGRYGRRSLSSSSWSSWKCASFCPSTSSPATTAPSSSVQRSQGVWKAISQRSGSLRS